MNHGVSEIKVMTETTVSKPLYKILTELTGEQRFDVALHLATKDLVRLKLQETEQQIRGFEERYGMVFKNFSKPGKMIRLLINTPMMWKKITGNGKPRRSISFGFVKYLRIFHESR